MMNPVEKFQSLLRELFQFDCADLNFGIYRIMNHKRQVIERFIAEDLPRAIDEELKRGALVEQSQAAQQLQAAKKKVLADLGADALDADGNLVKYQDSFTGRKYLEAQARAAGGRSYEALETTIYNHLYAFFSRYWQDGDFISKRRYSKKERYAIPYNGEEVTLYWANHDQYYIKTGEYFTDYTYKAPNGVSVHFKLQQADVEQNNVKGEKRFFLPCLNEIAWDEAGRELTIPFEYRPLTEQEKITYGKKNQQEAIIARAVTEIPKRVKAPEALAALTAERRQGAQGNPISYLEHHLHQYTRRNTSDFFIHKDLRGFLSRELDFYLKNEVLNLEEMEAAGEGLSEGWFQMLRLVKRVGSHIIEFLAQIEDFQKMLWEKRKFVAETFYCITAGNISQTFYPEIAACDMQWEEWRALFAFEAPQSAAQRLETLKAHPTLVLDTRHFPQDFVDRLLASFDTLDEMTDGLLVRSENWQALAVTQARYRERVKCIYIDPPYNTASNSIPYKNDYKHSSFASMMYDRTAVSYPLLAADGVTFVSIDKTERTTVEHALDRVFSSDNRVEEIIWVMNTTNSQVPTYSTNHEYVLAYAKDLPTAAGDPRMFREPKPGYEEVTALVQELNPLYPPSDEVGKAIRALYKQHQAEYRQEVEAQGLDWRREARNNPWRGIYPYNKAEYRDAHGQYVSDESARAKAAKIWVWQEGDMSMPATKQSPTTLESSDPNYRFYRPPHPVTGRPCPHPKSGWKFRCAEFDRLACDHRVAWGPDEAKVPRIKRYLHETESNVGKSVVVDYSDGEKETSALFGRSGVFLAPKPTSFVGRFIRQTNRDDGIVLDHFAGSGTTGHAVINLNREDGGRRRFILVEVADYFDTVLLPRIKKVTFTPEWKDGQPKRIASQEEFERGPRLVKVIRLESYEDALNNLTFDDESGQQALDLFKDDYLLRYMLKWETHKSETLLDAERLARPFSYRLHIHRDGETRVQPVDLPETFNYLLGLDVQSRRVLAGGEGRYLVYRGALRNGRTVAVIWRETEGWTEADYEHDRDFIAEQRLTEGADEVYVNGDSRIPGARALDGLFKERMFAPVEA